MQTRGLGFQPCTAADPVQSGKAVKNGRDRSGMEAALLNLARVE